MKTSTTSTTFILCFGLFASACSSTSYKNAQDTETINVDWGSTDLQAFSQHMVDSLIESPALGYLAGYFI